MVTELPHELLREVARGGGRISLVVGAGCSMEEPTSLKSSAEYAQDVHRQLIDDSVLEEGECPDSRDLAAIATTVLAKCGKQEPVVKRLPRDRFRHAKPNEGHLIAAALLREGALCAVLTLNFDLSMTSALTAVGVQEAEVGVVADPRAIGDLGATSLIYLHGNVDEADLEAWVLTTEALETGWQKGWREVVTQRVMTTSALVFAGLGSPASVLSETVSHLTDALGSGRLICVADPASTSEMLRQLETHGAVHLEMGWCDLMRRLGDRFLTELAAHIRAVGQELCDENGWPSIEAEALEGLAGRMHALGMVAAGGIRGRWLGSKEPYHVAGRDLRLVTDLALGLVQVERATAAEAEFDSDGLVVFTLQGGGLLKVRPMSGGGTRRWSAMEAQAWNEVRDASSLTRPDVVLLAGVPGTPPSDLAPPENLVRELLDGDIVRVGRLPRLVSVDDLRSTPDLLHEVLQ